MAQRGPHVREKRGIVPASFIRQRKAVHFAFGRVSRPNTYKWRTFSREQQFQILPLQIPQHAVVLGDNGRRQVTLAAL